MDWIVGKHDPDAKYRDWQSVLAQAFVRLEPQRGALNTPFRGIVRQCMSGELAVSEVGATAHTVHRIKEHASNSASDLTFINLHQTAGAITTQGKRTTHNNICDLSLVRTTEPFSIANQRPFSLLCFSVPTARVAPKLIELGTLRLSASDEGRQVSQLLQGYAALALRLRSVNLVRCEGLLEQALDLMTWAAEHGDFAQVGLSKNRKPNVDLIIWEIKRRASDPELTLSDVAASVGVSSRRVQQILSARGHSFRALVRDMRLDLASKLLVQDQSRSILNIVMSAGFSDVSHFSRCFKNRFGSSPTAYRTSHSDKFTSPVPKTH